MATNFISNIVGFADSIKEQTKAISNQSVKLLDSATKSINSTFVSNPEAGSSQTPPEDSHPEQIDKVKKNILLGLNRVVSEELLGIGGKDYAEINSFISKLESALNVTLTQAKENIKLSQGQFGDVVQTNCVDMDSGNTVDVLSASEVKVLRSMLTRAGTLIRTEAPVLMDTAYSRVLLAHTLLAEADLMINKAQSMLTAVKDEFGISADKVGIIAKSLVSVHSQKVSITGDRIDLNPVGVTKVDSVEVKNKSTVKKSVQLPQWSGMSPIPAFVSSTDEFKAQEG